MIFQTSRLVGNVLDSLRGSLFETSAFPHFFHRIQPSSTHQKNGSWRSRKIEELQIGGISQPPLTHFTSNLLLQILRSLPSSVFYKWQIFICKLVWHPQSPFFPSPFKLVPNAYSNLLWASRNSAFQIHCSSTTCFWIRHLKLKMRLNGTQKKSGITAKQLKIRMFQLQPRGLWGLPTSQRFCFFVQRTVLAAWLSFPQHRGVRLQVVIIFGREPISAGRKVCLRPEVPHGCNCASWPTKQREVLIHCKNKKHLPANISYLY